MPLNISSRVSIAIGKLADNDCNTLSDFHPNATTEKILSDWRHNWSNPFDRFNSSITASQDTTTKWIGVIKQNDTLVTLYAPIRTIVDGDHVIVFRTGKLNEPTLVMVKPNSISHSFIGSPPNKILTELGIKASDSSIDIDDLVKPDGIEKCTFEQFKFPATRSHQEAPAVTPLPTLIPIPFSENSPATHKIANALPESQGPHVKAFLSLVNDHRHRHGTSASMHCNTESTSENNWKSDGAGGKMITSEGSYLQDTLITELSIISPFHPEYGQVTEASNKRMLEICTDELNKRDVSTDPTTPQPSPIPNDPTNFGKMFGTALCQAMESHSTKKNSDSAASAAKTNWKALFITKVDTDNGDPTYAKFPTGVITNVFANTFANFHMKKKPLHEDPYLLDQEFNVMCLLGVDETDKKFVQMVQSNQLGNREATYETDEKKREKKITTMYISGEASEFSHVVTLFANMVLVFSSINNQFSATLLGKWTETAFEIFSSVRSQPLIKLMNENPHIAINIIREAQRVLACIVNTVTSDPAIQAAAATGSQVKRNTLISTTEGILEDTLKEFRQLVNGGSNLNYKSPFFEYLSKITTNSEFAPSVKTQRTKYNQSANGHTRNSTQGTSSNKSSNQQANDLTEDQKNFLKNKGFLVCSAKGKKPTYNGTFSEYDNKKACNGWIYQQAWCNNQSNCPKAHIFWNKCTEQEKKDLKSWVK